MRVLTALRAAGVMRLRTSFARAPPPDGGFDCPAPSCATSIAVIRRPILAFSACRACSAFRRVRSMSTGIGTPSLDGIFFVGSEQPHSPLLTTHLLYITLLLVT